MYLLKIFAVTPSSKAFSLVDELRTLKWLGEDVRAHLRGAHASEREWKERQQNVRLAGHRRQRHCAAGGGSEREVWRRVAGNRRMGSSRRHAVG